MYSKIIAVGKLQESAIMHVGNVKDVIVFRIYPDKTSSDEGDVYITPPIECKYEVYRGDDYLLALKPGTVVFVEGDVFVSESQETMLECVVKKMFMLVEQHSSYQV